MSQNYMSHVEAVEYVDLVIEELSRRGIISEIAYGKMPAELRDELAELIEQKANE